MIGTFYEWAAVDGEKSSGCKHIEGDFQHIARELIWPVLALGV
jgi:hypothetical protein